MFARPSLLVVEDDPPSGRALQRFFSDHFEVELGKSFDEARRRLEQRGFAGLCCDHYLTYGTGMELIRWQRALGRRMPILLITGAQNPELVNQVQALGAGLAYKPVFSDGLLAFAREVMRYCDRFEGALDVLARAAGLTDRETEILRLAVYGIPRGGIHLQLQVSEETVKKQVRSLLGKLGADSLLGAANSVLRGMIRPELC